MYLCGNFTLKSLFFCDLLPHTIFRNLKYGSNYNRWLYANKGFGIISVALAKNHGKQPPYYKAES
jgi:hypothetical protein